MYATIDKEVTITAGNKIEVNLNVLLEIQARGKLSDMAFAAKIGIDKTMLWRIKTRRNSPGCEFIAKFLTAYPNVKFEDIFFLKQSLQSCQGATGTEGS